MYIYQICGAVSCVVFACDVFDDWRVQSQRPPNEFCASSAHIRVVCGVLATCINLARLLLLFQLRAHARLALVALRCKRTNTYLCVYVYTIYYVLAAPRAHICVVVVVVVVVYCIIQFGPACACAQGSTDKRSASNRLATLV